MPATWTGAARSRLKFPSHGGLQHGDEGIDCRGSGHEEGRLHDTAILKNPTDGAACSPSPWSEILTATGSCLWDMACGILSFGHSKRRPILSSNLHFLPGHHHGPKVPCQRSSIEVEDAQTLQWTLICLSNWKRSLDISFLANFIGNASIS